MPNVDHLDGRKIRIIKELRGAVQEVWIDEINAAKLTIAFEKDGLATCGDAEAVLSALAAIPLEYRHGEAVVQTRVSISGLLDPHERLLSTDEKGIRTQPLRVLSVRAGDRYAYLTSDIEVGDGAGMMKLEAGQLPIEKVDGFPDLEAIRYSGLPNGVHVLPASVLNSFSHKSLRTADPSWLPIGMTAGIDVRVHDSVELNPLQNLASKLGLTMRHLHDAPRRRMARFTIKSDSVPDGRIEESLAGRLGEADPFIACVPVRRISGVAGGISATFVSSEPSDLGRYCENLLAGRWLGEGRSRTAVMPKDLLGDREPDAVLGATILVKFLRKNYANQSEEVEVPLVICGVTSGTDIHLNRGALDDIAGWQSGELICNSSDGSFKTPLETARMAGYERAVLWAVDDDHVVDLVTELRAKGYRTEDQIAAQQGLREMQKVLVGMVVFLCGLPFFQGLIALFRERQSYLAAKKFEIGVLKALGFRRVDLAIVYALQGLLIGVGAFAAAVLVALVGDPLFIRPWVGKVLSLPPEQFRGTLFSADIMGFPLWLAALTLSLGSMLLASLPTLRAARMQVVTLLAERY